MNLELLLLLSLGQGATVVPRPIALVDVAIVDVEAGKPREHQTVVLRGDHIDSIGPADATPLPEGASIVARGGFALPGLWDMHVHLTDSTEIVLPVLVAHGVTGVRDMGGDLEQIDAWRAEIDSGARIGPRIVRCGPYLDGAKPGLPYRVTLTDAGSARAAVEELAGKVDFLKVHNLVPREAYLALASAARERGIPIAGHVPVALSPIEAVRAGQKSIEHISSIFEARFVEPYPREPKLQLMAIERFVAEDHELIQALREAGTSITPTLVAVETARDAPSSPTLPTRACAGSRPRCAGSGTSTSRYDRRSAPPRSWQRAGSSSSSCCAGRAACTRPVSRCSSVPTSACATSSRVRRWWTSSGCSCAPA